MDFSKFVLGLRFPIMGNDVEKTAESMWELIFESLSAEEAIALDLHCLLQPADELHPDEALLCVLSNMSLGKCREIYASLSEKPMLRSYQMSHEPYILSNQAEAMEGYAYLGRVNEVGAVTGGEKSYASMRFAGPAYKKSIFKKRTPTVLFAPESYCGLLGTEESMRIMMRAASKIGKPVVCLPFPMAGNAVETADALIMTFGGRYATFLREDSSEPLLCCGVLPNKTVTLAAKTAQIAMEHIKAASNRGYRRFIVGIGEQLSEEIRDRFNDELFNEIDILLLDDTMQPEKYLDYTAFDKYLSRVKYVISGNGLTEDDPNCLSVALKNRCKLARKRIALLPIAEYQPETAEEARALLENSAMTLFKELF